MKSRPLPMIGVAILAMLFWIPAPSHAASTVTGYGIGGSPVVNCVLDSASIAPQLVGQWFGEATIDCGSAVASLKVQTKVIHNGTVVDDSGEVICFDCASIATGEQSGSCSSCSGVWTYSLDYAVKFPSSVVATSFPSGCSQIGTLPPLTVKCHFNIVY